MMVKDAMTTQKYDLDLVKLVRNNHTSTHIFPKKILYTYLNNINKLWEVVFEILLSVFIGLLFQKLYHG